MKNHYKQGAYVLALLGLLGASSCSKSYDDSALKESIGKIEQRAGTLDGFIQSANSNVQALQAIAQAAAGQDYLESYSQNRAGDLVLKFAKAGDVTLTQGTRGEDGVAPSITIAKAEDDKYYWQVNGQWMLNKQGQKVSAVPENGNTPRLKVEDGKWYVSYDNGVSWEPRALFTAVGAPGAAAVLNPGNNPSPVMRIDWSNRHYATFILRNGEEVIVPRELPDLWVEVEGEVPDMLFFGRAGVGEAPLKLRVRYTTEHNFNHVEVKAEGQIQIADKTEQVSQADDVRVRNVEILFRDAHWARPVETSGLQIGSIVVNLMGNNWHLLKTMVIPIKSRRSDTYARDRDITLPPAGGKVSVPLLLGSHESQLRIVYPGDTHFQIERRGDLLDITAPMNTSPNTISKVVEVYLKNGGPSVQVIRLRQATFTWGEKSYELNLGAGQSVAAQMSAQGYVAGKAIGQLKLRGVSTEQDLASFKSFVDANVALQVCGLDLSSLPIISLSREVMEQLQNVHVYNLLLPKTLRTIGQRALSGRSLDYLELPEGLSTISWGAFSNFKLRSNSRIIMPHTVTSLKGGAFDGCEINDIALSNGLTEVAEGVFINSKVQTIILPTKAGFNKIGKDAFYNCRDLMNIYCHHETPPALGSRAFTNVSSYARVHIPTGSKARYLASDWAKYFRPSAFVERAGTPIVEEIFYHTTFNSGNSGL